MNIYKCNWTSKRMLLVSWTQVIMKKIPVTQKWNYHPFKEINNATLHSPARILTFQRGKRGGKVHLKPCWCLQKHCFAMFFLHPRGNFFKATFLELYSCMRNASAPADKVIYAENWLPSKRKGGLLRCLWKRWKNFQNSSLMLYHIQNFQIHSCLDNHFRLQAPRALFISWLPRGFSAFSCPQSLLPVEYFQLCDTSIWLSFRME